jgi:NAD-dependent malate dehydrogenase
MGRGTLARCRTPLPLKSAAVAHRVTLIPGDGTGPELTEATRRVLEATGVEFEWDVREAGADVMEKYGGNPLPDDVLDAIRRTGVALKGPITTPIGVGFRSVNVALRKSLDLYGQVRPCKTYPGVRTRFDDVDLIIVRENTEDLYAGIEYEEGTPEVRELIDWIKSHGGNLAHEDAGISIKPISVTGTRRIVQFAFDYARRNGRRKVTAVHKANIMKFSDGLYLRVAREVAAENDDIEFDDRIVDNMCMQLVQRPEEYDVLVLPNLYGDVVSDLCAGMIGGLGLAPGANFGEGIAAPPGGARGCRQPRGCDRRRHPRGQERHLRHEAHALRPECRRHEPGGRRDHREARRARMRRKVTVVGAGNVGATCAQVLASRDYADVVLVDIKEGLPQGKALDINQMGAVLGYEPRVTGSNSYDETAGSDVVVITAGLPRSPGMSRDDLVATNEKIVKDVTEKVIAKSPDAILVVVSNPLDAMCHVAKNVSGWPKERVFGMAGILDTARFSTFIAWETQASVKDVTAMVLGGHGDQMVPVVSATTVGGIPLRKLVDDSQIESMVARTAKGGGELVDLLGTSAWYAPGAAAAQMVDSILLDEKRVLPCTAYLEGEYGIDGLYMGVPVRLGSGGIETVYELELSKEEQAMLDASAAAVREVVDLLTS